MDELHICGERRAASGERREAEGLANALADKLDAHNLSLDLLQNMVDALLDGIYMPIDPEVRGVPFDLVERVYAKCHSVASDIEPLITLFAPSDPGLIANTLLLLPRA